jgi:arginine deiminase
MPHVPSEVARLRRVVVKRPGAALERVMPRHLDANHPDHLLFDDLVHVPDAQREHDQLVRLLETTAEVGLLDDMLETTLELAEARTSVIERVARLEQLSDKVVNQLHQMAPKELLWALAVGGPESITWMNPLPNLIFTRDLAAVVGNTLVVGNARMRARRRESILTWSLVEHHPWFQGIPVSKHCRWVRSQGGSFPLTVEGGDILVISETLALIGASERTSWAMIIALARELIAAGFTRILVVEMPKQRSSMHLDTVFTLVDWDTAVVYGPLLRQGGPEEGNVIRLYKSGDAVAIEEWDGDLIDALAAEGYPMRTVLCGGGHPIHEQREQWSDGANYLALSPGVAVGYARNVRTAAAMSSAGFRVVSSDTFLQDLEQDFGGDYDALQASKRRYAVQIGGAELCRGRGGPRCLTLPLRRG